MSVHTCWATIDQFSLGLWTQIRESFRVTALQTSSDLIFIDIDRSQDGMFHRARNVRSTGPDGVCREDE